MGTVGVMASAVMGVYSQNKALEAQGRANAQTARNYITSMNYSFQNLEQERSDAFDATVADLQKTRLQGNRMSKSVDAAVNEGLMGGGRTANLVKRAARADTARAVDASKDNYRRKSNEIDLNKEATLLGTQRQIGAIQQVKRPSLLSTLVQLGTSYYSARQTEDAIHAIRGQAGVGQGAKGTVTQKPFDSNLNMYFNVNESVVDSVFKRETDWLAPSEGARRNYTFSNPFTTPRNFF